MLAEPVTQSAMIPAMPMIPDIHTTESGFKLAELAAKSGLCKTRNPYDAFFVIGYGMELGIPPMTALRTIHVINNTPSCSGQAMLALIRRSNKVTVTITGSATEAKVYMKRRDTGDEYTAHWTIERAQTAGLLSNPTWKKFPQQMLQWRGVSEAAVFLCSDIIGGLYTVEEIAPQITVDESGEPVETQVITVSKPEPEAPKTAKECLQDDDCRKRFVSLCAELKILSAVEDEKYLAALKISRYSEYAGTFDELCQEMRDLNEAFNMPTPDAEPEPSPATVSMTTEEAVQKLGKGDKTPIGRDPVITKDPVEDAALNQQAEQIADGLAASKAPPLPKGKSPFASSSIDAPVKTDYVQPPF